MRPDQIIKNGYIAIPLAPGTKAPPITKGWEDLRPDTAPRIWERAPVAANIGIVTADIVCVTDWDSHGEHPNGADVFESLFKEHPSAFCDAIIERTPSGGYHVSFKGMAGEKTYARFDFEGRTIDIEVLRGRRYTVIPPSKTEKGVYTHISIRTHENTPASSLPELPDLIKAAITRYEAETAAKRARPIPGAGPIRTGDRLDTLDLEVCAEKLMGSYLAGASEGHRHDQALGYACNLFSLGMSESEVRKYLQEYARLVSRDMQDKEIEGILRYAPLYRSEPCIPWKAVWSDRKRRGTQRKMELIRGGSHVR